VLLEVGLKTEKKWRIVFGAGKASCEVEVEWGPRENKALDFKDNNLACAPVGVKQTWVN